MAFEGNYTQQLNNTCLLQGEDSVFPTWRYNTDSLLPPCIRELSRLT